MERGVRLRTLPLAMATIICMAQGCAHLAAAWPIQLSPERVGSVGETPEANDVAVSGGIAALAQNRGGIDVLDVSVTDNPRLMGRWRGSRQVVGVDLVGSLAFAACGDEGFFVVDLSDPGNPRTLGSCGIPGWASDVVVVGVLAYVAAGDLGILVVDVSDPASPRWRGRVGTSGWAQHLVVVGDLAYVAATGGLDIVDVADPDAPSISGTIGGIWFCDVAVVGQRAFAVANDTSVGLAVIDVADPANPVIASSVRPEDPWSPQRVAVRDGFAYVTEYYNGLHVFDVSDPAHPALVGPAIPSGVGSSWSGLAASGAELYLAADRGVTVWSLASPTAPTEDGAYGSQAGIYAVGSAARLPLICIAAYRRGLVLLDASDRRAPREIGSCALPAPALEVAMEGDIAVLACGEAGSAIVDIADPAWPGLLAMCEIPASTEARAIAISGGLVVVGYSVPYEADWIQIIDVSDPANPTVLSSMPTGGGVDAVLVAGTLAFVGGSEGLCVIDLSDPAVPKVVGRYGNGPGSRADINCLEISGELLFAGEGDEGFEILDVSDPSNPRRLGGSSTFEDCYALTAVGERLLVADDQAGVTVFDVSDPSAPRAIGRYPDLRGARGKIVVEGDIGFVPYSNEGVQVLDFSRIAPAQIVGWLDIDGHPNRVAFDGSQGWAGEGDDLLSMDLSVPASPRLTGAFEGFEYVASMGVRGNHIFMADGEGGFRVVDISDPAAPQTVAVLPMPGWANGLRLDGDHAFVTVSVAGVAVVDISDPTAPSLVGQVDTGGEAYNLALASGNLALVADMGGGLVVIDVSDPTSPQLVGSCSVGGGARDVAVSGTCAFVACEYEGLRVVDFSDPHNPELVAGLRVANSPRSIAIIGSVAYLSDEIYGLVAVDISDPMRPIGLGGNALHAAWKVSSDGSRIYLSGYYDDLSVLEPYDDWFQWRVDRLGSAPGGPFGPEAREGDDPDCDGLPNLMEFALSMDPLQRDGETVTGGELVIGDAGEPVLRFTVRRNGVNDAVDYVVEVSEDLVGWRFDPALLTTVRDDGTALVVDVAMGPDSPVARFARLRVVRR